MVSRETYLRIISISVVALMLLSALGLTGSNAEAEEPDSDFDGLSDRYEEAIGTDPNNPDTDADGIPDADDPTPKGGMLNTEEIWETWDIQGKLEIPVIKALEEFNVSFTVSRVLPDGTNVIPETLDATLFVYATRSYYTLDRSLKKEITIINGTYTYTHIADEPAKYYFILGVNASKVTLGVHARTNEIARLSREMKIGYVKGSAYPELFTTVKSIYPTLLPGHRAHYYIQRFAYSPSDNTYEFLSRFTGYHTPSPVLDSLYTPANGTAYLHLFKSSLLNKTSVNIPLEGLYYNITLEQIGRYNLAVTAYDVPIPWDFSYSVKFPYSRAYTYVMNPTVSWVQLDNPEPDVYDNVSIELHKYSITTTMNESDFSLWYANGGLRGIAVAHPEHADPYDTDVWLSLFYYVYVPGSGATAYTMFDRSLTLKGLASTNYEFELPGRYIAAANFHPQQPHHPQGTFPIYTWNGYKLSSNYNRLHYFNCGSDVYLNAFKSGNVYFTDTGSNVSVTGTKGAGSMASWEFAVYLDGGYSSTELFADYDKTVDLGQLAKGKHDFRAVAIFSPKTRTIVEALGAKNFPYNWIGHTTFQVKDFLLYINTPSTLVKGHSANVSVLVYGSGIVPVENANIEIHMSGRSVPRRRMTTGKTGVDGLASLSFLPPAGNYYRLEITASKGALTGKVETYAWIRSEQFSGYIHTNKPVYLPGDTILAQFTLYDMDNAIPLGGPIDVRLSYDGNGKDIIRENLVLDEFGTAETEFPISKDAPWGTYRIAVYHDGSYVVGRDVGVRYYETPDTRIVFDEDISLRTGVVEIPVKVEYMFGAPVYQGEVSYLIQGYENRYEYNPWYWWGEIDMDGIYSGGDGDYWGGWWNDPAPLITLEINETVENGWANTTLDIPKGVNRIELEAVFSDDYDHSCEAATTYYVGEAPDPDLKTGIDIVPSKEPFVATDEPKFTLNTYNYREIEKGTDEIDVQRIANISTTLMINVTSFGMIGKNEGWLPERAETLFNVTTDRNGIAQIDLAAAGVDVFNLSAQGRYYFKIAVSTASDNTPPVSMEYEFFVHTVIYTVRNAPAAFAPGSNATITLGAESLVPTIDADYNYTLSVFKRERYYGYYDNYYYSFYDASPVFAVSGKAVGLINVTWRLPEHLESGRYIIRVSFENSQHETVIDHPVEVVDKSPLEITLIPSKLEYFPGDIIDVQLDLSEEFTGFVYLSVSAGWDVITKNRYVNGRAAQFTFTTKDWHHDIDLTVFLVDDMARLITSSAVINYGIRPLELILEMDKPAYEPGESTKLTVTVLESDGFPAAGVQVSISVVDAAVFEIFQDFSAKTFYDNLVTPWAFEWSYRTILNWDSDTWYPESLPSETVSYWPNIKLNGIEPDPLGDADGDGMAENGAGQGQGGGYEGEEAPKDAELGDALQSELDNTDVREWFTDTALWLPWITTGQDGRAIIDLTLPDNIGKWRIRGTGLTQGLVGGENTATFNVSKVFFIEPKLPYKMTQDDEIEMKVLLYNFHDTEIEAELGVSADDWIKVFGEVQIKVKIPANSIAEHLYRMKIFGAMKNNLTFIASDFKGSTDAVRKEVFVKPNGALLVSHATGAVDPTVTEIFDFHEELINGTQKTVLRLAPGYQGLLKMGFSMLAGYPYDCTEQITSRMIPAVLYREYLKETGDLERWTDRYLTRKIYTELQSLLAKQHLDGGWGWWKGDDSSLWMSGWVLLGLSTTKDSGFFVDPQSIADCQDFLMMRIGEDGTWMPGPGDDMDDVALTAFLYFSLARSGIPAPQPTEQSLQRIMQEGNLTPYGLSHYGLGDTELGGQQIAPIMADLTDMKIGSHFESDNALGGQTECTAWVLYLAAKANDDPALIRELLEWLNSRRLSTGDFGTTTATVAYMFAVLEVLRNAQPIDMDITVTVNGKRIAREHVNDRTYRNFYNKMDAMDITEYLNTDGPNNISISKDGTGELFYELTTVEYLRKDVVVNFDTNLSMYRGDTLSFEVTADPVNSKNVKVIDLDVRVSSGRNLIYLNSQSDHPADSDSSRKFSFNFLGAGAGTAKISPIIVNYKLSAGQRESGLITKYYGPVTVKVQNMPTRGTDTRGLSGGPGISVKLEKSADAFAMRTNNDMNIKLKVSIEGTEEQRDGMGSVRIRDHLPASLSQGNVELTGENFVEFAVDTSKDYQEFSYEVSCPEDYRGDLGTAVLMADDNVLTYAEGSALTVSSSDYFIQRSYSDTSVELFSPITVKIKAWSDETLRFVAVEDYICPGFKVDETSLETVVENSNGNVLSFEISDDHVTFFISTLDELEMEYEVVPMLPGRFVSPPALVFPMYSPDDTVQSDSHRIKVNPTNTHWGLKYVEEEGTVGQEDDDDNDTGEPDGDDDVEESEKPDIPVDVNLPDGPGDGDPEPIDDEDDDPIIDEDDDIDADDDNGRAGGQGEGVGEKAALGSVIQAVIVLSVLLLIIVVLMILKRHRKRNRAGSGIPGTGPSESESMRKKVENRKRVVVRKRIVKNDRPDTSENIDLKTGEGPDIDP